MVQPACSDVPPWVFVSDLTSHKSKTTPWGQKKVAIVERWLLVEVWLKYSLLSVLEKCPSCREPWNYLITETPPPYLRVWMTGHPSPALSQGLDPARQEACLRSETIRKDLPVYKRHTHPPIPPLEILPPTLSWCCTYLNKHCAVTSTATSAELMALGNSPTLDGLDSKLVLTVLSWLILMSSVSVSLILHKRYKAALVWLKWQKSLSNSSLSPQVCVSPIVIPYSFKVSLYWLSDKWGFCRRNCRSKVFDLPRASRDNLNFPR